MTDFLGTFKMYDSQNFDEYMKALGVDKVTREMAASVTPVEDITLDGETYTIKTTTTIQRTEIQFKLGEASLQSAEGSKIPVLTTIVVKDGDKLVQTQGIREKRTTVIRDFSTPNEMKMTLSVDGVTCIRNFRKE